MKATYVKIRFPYTWMLEQFKKGNTTVIQTALERIKKLFGDDVTVVVSKDVQSIALIVASEKNVSEQTVLNELKNEQIFQSEEAALQVEAQEISAEQLKKLLVDMGKKLTDSEREFFKTKFEINIEKEEDFSGSANADRIEKDQNMSFEELMQEMVGIAPLEAWVEQMTAIGKKHKSFAEKNKLIKSFAYVISINRGNGLSTILQMMRYHMLQLGFMEKKSDVMELKLRYTDEVEDLGPIAHVLERIAGSPEQCKPSFEGIVAIDLDDWLDHLHDSRLDILLDFMWKTKEKVTFVFTLPYVDDTIMKKVCERVDDVLTVWKMKFAPVSDERYFEVFQKRMKKSGIEAEDAVKDAFIAKITEEKNDGKFYGFNTVEKILQEVLYRAVSEAALQDKDIPETITKQDFERWYKIEAEDEISGLEQLSQMVGLHEVRNKICEILSVTKMQKNLSKQDKEAIKPCYHMMFAGNPGTGKTVVARIIGRIFKEEGLLSVGNFFEVSRQDLVGRFVGHTAPKTMEICRNAYGSVLFIDEAYLLAEDSGHGYGSEAIGTLIAAMENQRDNMVVIFAGYEDDLEKLFADNAGLRDRIPHKIVFPNYSREELKEIFFLQLRKGVTYNEGFCAAADSFFRELPDELLNNKEFSNGRFVRNLAERIVSKAAMRYDMENITPERYELTEGDFSLAIGDADYKRLLDKPERRRNRIGF